MHVRHSSKLPRRWLLTDERQGDVLASVSALPKGSGIIFRHFSLSKEERRALLTALRGIAGKRRLLLFDGFAGQSRRGAPAVQVHSVRERIKAERSGAALLFVSPLYSTRSHPGARALGRVRFGMIIRGSKRPVIALGGMNEARARRMAAFNIHGWAGIDAFAQ